MNRSGWSKKNGENERERTRRLALDILGIDRRQFEREPKFEHILRDRSLGGLAQVLEAMRLSGDPIIQKFIERYDQMNRELQKIAPWEAVAMVAGINGRELLGAIILALRAHSATEVKIAALTAHAEVTRATVEAALLPEGYRDRLAIHQALGFLAPPKGQTINVNFPGMDAGSETSNAEIAAEDIDMNEMFPDLMATQRKMLPD